MAEDSETSIKIYLREIRQTLAYRTRCLDITSVVKYCVSRVGPKGFEPLTKGL